MTSSPTHLTVKIALMLGLAPTHYAILAPLDFRSNVPKFNHWLGSLKTKTIDFPRDSMDSNLFIVGSMHLESGVIHVTIERFAHVLN